jgi:hypothetical protein
MNASIGRMTFRTNSGGKSQNAGAAATTAVNSHPRQPCPRPICGPSRVRRRELVKRRVPSRPLITGFNWRGAGLAREGHGSGDPGAEPLDRNGVTDHSTERRHL